MTPEAGRPEVEGGLRAAVEALADDWEQETRPCGAMTPSAFAADLRHALAAAPPQPDQAVTATVERVRTDYGLRIDCAANGCTEPHSDDGEVLPRGNAQPVIELVNGHAVTAVQRTVTYTAWTAVADALGTAGEAGS